MNCSAGGEKPPWGVGPYGRLADRAAVGEDVLIRPLPRKGTGSPFGIESPWRETVSLPDGAANTTSMTRGGDEVAAPIVRRNEIVSQRPHRGISSMVKASMMSPAP